MIKNLFEKEISLVAGGASFCICATPTECVSLSSENIAKIHGPDSCPEVCKGYYWYNIAYGTAHSRIFASEGNYSGGPCLPKYS